MAGALLTLFNTMAASPLLDPSVFPGITQTFGEESLVFQGEPPRVVWVPASSSFDSPGRGGNYAGDGTNAQRALWKVNDVIEAHLWAAAASPTAQPQDHADAVETLRQAVLQALGAQIFTGYFYRPVRGVWKTAEGELTRRGRSYVLFIEAISSVTTPPDQTAQITTVTINPVVTPFGGT